MRAKDAAPGPDGVHGRVWDLAFGALGDRLVRLFEACLESGRFPKQWKTGRLVLLRKEGRPADSPAGYRPIVLLDEAGKLLERVVAARIVQHLTGVGPDLSAEQFGFREGRSTIDAVMRVRALSDEAVGRGGVTLAVSLDIANAFNTLPWSVIGGALERHGVPPYLR
ncbi:reverse transcriptase family protein, partial [Pseudomonas aeruginosa]